MKLLLVRHAAAVPSGTPGVSDDERPLTAEGEARFRLAAAGLARITDRPDVLLTSPLARARATAGIAARAFGGLEPALEPALAHGTAETILTALAAHASATTMVVVGHEPLLSAVVARLVGVRDSERVAFKKGGAALVDLPHGLFGAGRLVWFLQPRILRTLARGEEQRRPMHPQGPPLLTRVLTRLAATGIYLVRGVPRDLQRGARVRAAREGTTLHWVLLQALRDYAAGAWTPRRDDKSSRVA